MKTLLACLPARAFGWLLVGLITLAASCQRLDEAETVVPGAGRKPLKLDGIWESEGYGYVMDIRKGQATVYDVTESTCLKKTFFFDAAGPEASQWDVSLLNKGDLLLYRTKGAINEIRFHRLKKLPPVCDNGGIRPTADAKTNFDFLWQTFRNHYAFFSQRNVNWEQLRAQYRPRVNEQNLRAVLEEMLTHFNEDHVTLSVDGDDFLNRFDAGVTRTFGRFYAENPPGISQRDLKLYVAAQYESLLGSIMTRYLQGNFKTALDNQLIWGKLNEQTGYLLIAQMAGYELSDLRTALDEATQDLKDTKGMVVDVRFNLGGADRVTLEIAGRFAAETQPAWTFQARNGDGFAPLQRVAVAPTGSYTYTKPVVLLTSIFTSSAAECFTLTMKQLPHVRTMGEATNGIFSTMLSKELPNGWRFTLSNEVVYSIPGQVYEAVGIPPDLAAPFPTLAQREAGIDPGIEAALTQF